MNILADWKKFQTLPPGVSTSPPSFQLFSRCLAPPAGGCVKQLQGDESLQFTQQSVVLWHFGKKAKSISGGFSICTADYSANVNWKQLV